MQKNLLKEIVEFLGLDANSSSVYEWLLFNKDINVTVIAKQTSLNRVQVYKAFDDLASSGLIQKPKGLNRQIVVENPRIILSGLKQKQIQAESYFKSVESILSDLELHQAENNKQIPVKLIQGKTQFEELFLEMYEASQKELLFIGNADEFYNFLDVNYIDFAISTRIKKGVKHKVLTFQPGNSLKKIANRNKNDLREVRFLPSNFSSLGYLNIYDNKIVNWNTQLSRAIVIQDSLMANFYKTIFEILWSSCSTEK